MLSDLATLLYNKYCDTGDLFKLEEATQATREAISLTLKNSRDLPSLNIALSISLTIQYQETALVSYSDKASKTAELVLRNTYPWVPEHAYLLIILGDIYLERFNKTGEDHWRGRASLEYLWGVRSSYSYVNDRIAAGARVLATCEDTLYRIYGTLPN